MTPVAYQTTLLKLLDKTVDISTSISVSDYVWQFQLYDTSVFIKSMEHEVVKIDIQSAKNYGLLHKSYLLPEDKIKPLIKELIYKLESSNNNKELELLGRDIFETQKQKALELLNHENLSYHLSEDRVVYKENNVSIMFDIEPNFKLGYMKIFHFCEVYKNEKQPIYTYFLPFWEKDNYTVIKNEYDKNLNSRHANIIKDPLLDILENGKDTKLSKLLLHYKLDNILSSQEEKPPKLGKI